MALTLSQRCMNITPSVTLAIDAKAKAMLREGQDVIGFGAGEPDFDTPEYIRDAAKYALDNGMTRYTPVAGTLQLRREIASKLTRDNHITYDLDEILVSNGAKQSVFNALTALVNPGDEVLLPAPCWVSYPEMIKIAGGVPVMLPSREENGFLLRADEIRPYVTSRTKALILNSPNNPNGTVWPREILAGIADLAVEKGFYVLSDEIYEKLIYDGREHVSIASLNEAIKRQTVVVNGVSKSYAMTGWRIGYAAGPREIIRLMCSYQSHSTSNANSVAQFAAAMALTNGEEGMQIMRDEFDARRKRICGLIADIDGISAHTPLGAFYIMLNISRLFPRKLNGVPIENALNFADRLLDIEKVAVVPGTPFGSPDHVRLSYAVSQEKITRGMERIAHFVRLLE